MITGNRIEVFLSDELKDKTKLFNLTKDVFPDSSHDNGFMLMNLENNLEITFEDISNFSIDYANNGHLAFVMATPWLLVSIPEIVSDSQLEILDNIMNDLDDNILAIYAFINNKLEQYILNENYEDNKDMLTKVLKKKKLV